MQRRTFSRRSWLGMVVAPALLAGATGCALTPPRGDSTLLGRMVTVCRGDRGAPPGLSTNARVVPSGAVRGKRELPPKLYRPVPPRRRAVFDPVLEEWLAAGPPERRVKVLVTWRERVEMPRLPELDERQPRDSKENRSRVSRGRAAIRAIEARRATAYRRAWATLAKLPGAVILERFWIAPTVAVELPLASVRAIARDSTVVHVEPAVGRDPPPDCDPPPTAANNGLVDDVAAGLAVLKSEAYRELNLPHGVVGLLDTGVWREHQLLAGANLGVRGDCVNGGKDCLPFGVGDSPMFSASDACKNEKGHGTGSAAILVGTGALGPRSRGGLDLMLDTYQVFVPGNCTGPCALCLDRASALRAFEAIRADLVPVIVANVEARTDDVSALCYAADGAFRSGAVVLAANGSNQPVAYAVGSPAAAACALGVGSRDLMALHKTEAAQNHGPAEGERLKPDVQAPTGSETARYFAECPQFTHLLSTYAGTSGATPFAGVAAAMLRDFMRSTGAPFAPGHVYAAMILSGRNRAPNLSSVEGAGLLNLPTNCCWAYGTETVRVTAPVVEIPFVVPANEADSVEAALWWPEYQSVGEANDEPVPHDDVDLALVAPDGTVAAESREVWSVFERATAPVSGRHGTWKLRISGAKFFNPFEEDDPESQPDPTRSARVYWAAAARRAR